MKIRVYYEDTDIAGIVYHSNYIKYCERARSEIFFEKEVELLNENKGGFIVKSLNANFVSTATLGDLLEVKTKILERKKVSMCLEQIVYKEDVKVFSMEILLVYVENMKMKKIPDSFIALFEKM